jgi:hypothetical protein
VRKEERKRSGMSSGRSQWISRTGKSTNPPGREAPPWLRCEAQIPGPGCEPPLVACSMCPTTPRATRDAIPLPRHYPAIPRFLLGKPSKMWRSPPLLAHIPRLRSESGRRQPSTNYSLPLHAVSLSNNVFLHHKPIHYIGHCLSLSLVVGMYVYIHTT